MSMTGEYRRIAPSQLYDLQEALQRDPYAVTAFLHPEERSYEKPDPKLQIGKAWHGLHFLLNGKAWEGEPPLFNAVLGGTEIGDDLGYGAMRYLTPEQVKEVAAVLNQVQEPELRSRFDASAFTQARIYPQGWEKSNGRTLVGFGEAFVSVRSFFTGAACFGDVMLLYLS